MGAGWLIGPAADGGIDVGVREVVALEQQWLPRVGGQGVGEAVTEVQPCRVAGPASVVAVGRASGAGLGWCEGHHLDPPGLQQPVEPSAVRGVANPADHESEFHVRRCRHQRPGVGAQCRIELPPAVLPVENGDYGRGIDDHRGRPVSS